MKTRLIIHQVDLESLRAGGIDTCIRDMVAYAPEDWALAVVGATTGPGPLGKWRNVAVADREVPFLPVARLDHSGRGRRIPDTAKLAFGLTKYRRRLPSGEIQVHRPDVAFLARRILPSRPVIQFLHGDGMSGLGPDSDSVWRHAPKIGGRLESSSVRAADQVHIFSRPGADRLRAIRPDIKAWRTWYDPRLFHSSESTPDVDILWIGRLERPKDPLLAIETIASVVEKRGDLSAVMVGAGAMAKELAAAIETRDVGRNVSLISHLPRAELAELMRRSSVLLMTSHFEGSPRVLIEGLASGQAVVATSESDPDRALAPVARARSIDSRDPDELAAACLTLLDEPRSQTAVSEWSAPRVIERILNS